MTKSFPLSLIVGTAALCFGAGGASAAPQMKPTATPKPMGKANTMHAMPVASTRIPAKSAMARKPAATAGGRMVSAKLANGKTVTYNCSLAGNRAKSACK